MTPEEKEDLIKDIIDKINENAKAAELEKSQKLKEIQETEKQQTTQIIKKAMNL